MTYNPNRGSIVKGIIVVAILSSVHGMWKSGLEQYRQENPYVGMPQEFQSTMGEMGLEYAYTGEVNTKIEEMLLLYDAVDSAEASVITSNGEVYRVSVTVTGSGWTNYTTSFANKIREMYPGVTVTFYDSNVNIIYSE